MSLAAGRLHETATTSDGRVAETVTSGPQVWGRRADNRDDLAAVPYETVPVPSDAEPATKGAVLLPSWLASAVGPADAGPDESGRRRFSATVPAAVLGAVERQRPPVDATVVLTVDAVGAPVRVEITSAPGGPTLHLVYDLAGWALRSTSSRPPDHPPCRRARRSPPGGRARPVAAAPTSRNDDGHGDRRQPPTARGRGRRPPRP